MPTHDAASGFMAAALIEVPNFIFVMNICMVTMLISPTIITRNDSGWIAEPRTSTVTTENIDGN